MIFSSETLNKRQNQVAQAWKPLMKSEDVILVSSGKFQQKPGGLDQNYPYLPHPEYYWLTGDRRAQSFLVFHTSEGWSHFVHHPSTQDLIWEKGDPHPAHCRPSSELASYLKNLQAKNLFEFGQPDGHSGSAPDQVRRDQLQLAFDKIRRRKDSEEIDLVRQSSRAASAGFAKISDILRPGLSERELQIEFEAEIQRSGADGTPYETIVGSGPNSAILHAVPTKKVIMDDELVLIDAGAQIAEYCVDITRVLHSQNNLSGQKKDLYDLVCRAQNSALAICRPQVEWSEVHRAAAHTLAEGLKDFGLMKGSTEDILDSGAISLFFPHGVGHFVGLRVRDTGCLENKSPKTHCGVRLRIDLKLEQHHLVTVEPGCYFISGLLHQNSSRLYKDFVNFEKLNTWLPLGGVRIEDDILITQNGCENLTAQIKK